jgi:hypothetical protein
LRSRTPKPAGLTKGRLASSGAKTAGLSESGLAGGGSEACKARKQQQRGSSINLLMG